MTKNLLFFIALSALLPLALISCDNSSSPPLIPISIANPTSGNPTSGNPNDWDGDGLSNLDEMNVHHTNPYDADTDGDGYNDYEEAVTLKNDNTNKFNPLIADTPEVQIEITATPAITLIKTTSEGQTQQVSVTKSDSQTTTSTSSNSRSRSASWEGGFTVGASYTHNWGITNGAATEATSSQAFMKKPPELNSRIPHAMVISVVAPAYMQIFRYLGSKRSLLDQFTPQLLLDANC